MKQSSYELTGSEKADSVIVFLVVVLIGIAFTPTTEGGVLSLTLDSKRIQRLGFLMAATVLIAGYGGYFRRIRVRTRDTSFLIASAFGVWALVSANWSLVPTFTFLKAFEYLLLVTIVATTVATVNYSTTSAYRFARIVAFALTTVVILYLFFNLLEFGTPFHGVPSNRGNRFALGYAHPLETADIVSLALIALIAAKGSWWWRLPLATGLLILIVWSKPLAPGFGLIAGLLAMTWPIIRKENRLISVYFLCFLGVIGFSSFETLRADIALPQEATQYLGTLSGRLPLWEFALQQAWEKPIAGHGFFSSRFIVMDRFAFAGTAHNTFIDILLTTGIVGLILLAVFSWYVVRGGWMLKNRMLIGTSIFCLTHALTDYVIFTPGVPTAVLLLAVLAANRESEAGRNALFSSPKAF